MILTGNTSQRTIVSGCYRTNPLWYVYIHSLVGHGIVHDNEWTQVVLP